MEYIFGISGPTENEILKTKGEEFTDLSDWQQHVQEFPDCVRTDNFRVVAKVGQDTDADGNKYTWYEIDHHNTIIDKTPLLAAKLDYLSMMTGVDLETETAETETTEEDTEEGGSDDGTQSEV